MHSSVHVQMCMHMQFGPPSCSIGLHWVGGTVCTSEAISHPVCLNQNEDKRCLGQRFCATICDGNLTPFPGLSPLHKLYQVGKFNTQWTICSVSHTKWGRGCVLRNYFTSVATGSPGLLIESCFRCSVSIERWFAGSEGFFSRTAMLKNFLADCWARSRIRAQSVMQWPHESCFVPQASNHGSWYDKKLEYKFCRDKVPPVTDNSLPGREWGWLGSHIAE